MLYKNNKIIFNPSFKDFRKVFLDAYEKIIAMVSMIPRIETKLYLQGLVNSDKLYLKVSTKVSRVDTHLSSKAHLSAFSAITCHL